LMGKMKSGRRRFASTTRARVRAANGGAWCGGTRGDDSDPGDWRLEMTAGGSVGPRWDRRLGQSEKDCRRNPFEFLNNILNSKIKGFKYF
jgi:hypothetical protein